MQPLTLQFFRDRLRANRNTLDDAHEVHAEMQEQISSELARQNSRAISLKDELARCEARLLIDAKEGGVKITKDEAEAIVSRHPERRDAWRTYQQAREDAELWQGLYDAWKQKGKDLEALGRLYASQYFAVRSSGAAAERPIRRPRRSALPD